MKTTPNTHLKVREEFSAQVRKEIPHGMPKGFTSPSGYINHGCRCDACKDAYRTYMAKWRKAHPDWRKDYLKNRSLIWVTCGECGWRNRRDESNGWDAVEAKPCPHCGGKVAV